MSANAGADQAREIIKSSFDHFNNELSIEKDVELIGANSFASIGASILPGKAVITYPPQIVVLSRGITNFSVAHELTHIKNNDGLIINGSRLLTYLVTKKALLTLFPSLGVPTRCYISIAAIISYFFGMFAFNEISKKAETRADMTAISVCSKDDCLSMALFLKNLMFSNLKRREKDSFSRHTIDEHGNSKWNAPEHPLHTERLQYIFNAHPSIATDPRYIRGIENMKKVIEQENK